MPAHGAGKFFYFPRAFLTIFTQIVRYNGGKRGERMEQTVYVDLLFLVNFCMDFQCLFLAGKLLHRPFHVWRALIFASLGAVYAVAALFLSTSRVNPLHHKHGANRRTRTN